MLATSFFSRPIDRIRFRKNVLPLPYSPITRRKAVPPTATRSRSFEQALYFVGAAYLDQVLTDVGDDTGPQCLYQRIAVLEANIHAVSLTTRSQLMSIGSSPSRIGESKRSNAASLILSNAPSTMSPRFEHNCSASDRVHCDFESNALSKSACSGSSPRRVSCPFPVTATMSTCSSVDSNTLSRIVEIFADSERSAAIRSTSNWIPPAPGTPIVPSGRGDFALRLNRVNLAI